ncbi:MAG: tRNA (adenosine(37)-N6)-dimethylallyltransferase MiaA [Planctomycetes bacterium]|nr:tRNA (adenosine(37)-N6)-dimethylallyltransferase MiaA [Planctomycetota bacterium]
MSHAPDARAPARESALRDPLGGTPLTALVGPTASGKSAVALLVAEAAGAEIVSLDALQVYRGLDVGTAKPTAEERARVPHHLIDVADPRERYDVTRFLADLSVALASIRARGRRALFVGGTGFYLRALAEGLFRGPDVDPALRAELEERARRDGPAALHAELVRADPTAAARLHPNDVKRVVRALEVFHQTGRPLSAWQTQWGRGAGAPRTLVGLSVSVPELDRRIAARAQAMLAAGWPAEAVALRAAGGLGPTAAQAIGYAEALAVHDGTLTPAEAARRIALATRQFARRQRTWYRKFPDLRWLDAERRAPADLAEEARRALGW